MRGVPWSPHDDCKQQNKAAKDKRKHLAAYPAFPIPTIRHAHSPYDDEKRALAAMVPLVSPGKAMRSPRPLRPGRVPVNTAMSSD
jgi:hypothetical protein